jgi:hypothetical protein
MAEQRHAVILIHAEMADPKPFISTGQQFVERGAALFRHFEIERAGKMHCGYFMRPAEIEAVIAPFSGRFRRHLGIRTAVEHPFICGDDLLHHIERVGGGL